MEQAKNTFKFYFKYLFGKANLIWESDNDAEIDSAIDSLFNAAVAEAVKQAELDEDVLKRRLGL